MTPANIAGMAAVKGLNVLALTDHNSCKNCGPFLKMTEEYGILGIPGMELTTSEDVHVVCLFPDLYAAMDFDAYVYAHMFKIQNKSTIFGAQLLYNDQDEIIGEEPNLLIGSSSISFDEVFSLMKDYHGVMIPAHIDKDSNSLLANLGFVPPDSQFRCIEMKDVTHFSQIAKTNPYLYQCQMLINSDAHYLEHISEPEHILSVDQCTTKDILQHLNTYKNLY